jgi:hypothetical protein
MGGKVNIKVDKQPNGQVRVVIEGLSIAGNMLDVEVRCAAILKSSWDSNHKGSAAAA